MEYEKLNTNDKCAFPKRKVCNYTDTVARCKYMKYDNNCSIFDSKRWKCIFKNGKETKF